jgi:glycosyltransferase involved in cell wall biosynthesis
MVADEDDGGRMALISVLLPVRNAAPYLDAALDSLRRQSLADFEVIAVDDGSTDESPTILARVAAADRRFKIHRREPRGLVAALNFGLDLAGGRYLARMDADDVAWPDRFAAQAAYLAGHDKVALVGGAYQEIDEAGRPGRTRSMPAEPAAIRAELGRRNAIAHPTVMARHAALMAAGGYRAAFVAAEDYDLWLRLSEVADLANLPAVVLSHRLHRATVSIDQVAQQILSEYAAREAARRRRRGEADPTTGWDRVTQERLEGLGLDRALLDRRIRNRELRLARESWRRGDREVAGTLAALAAARLPASAGLVERLGFHARRIQIRL